MVSEVSHLIIACDNLPEDQRRDWYQKFIDEPFEDRPFQSVLAVLGSDVDRKALISWYDGDEISPRQRISFVGVGYLDPKKQIYADLFFWQYVNFRAMDRQRFPNGSVFQPSRSIWEPSYTVKS